MSETKNNAEIVRDLAVVSADGVKIGSESLQIIALPDGWGIHSNADLLSRPRLANTNLKFARPEDLLEYASTYKGSGTVVFFNTEERTVAVVVDYHEPHDGTVLPAWSKHSGSYTGKLSPEFQLFKGSIGKTFSHVSFAEFLQDVMRYIVDPPGADLMEAITTMRFSATNSAVSVVNVTEGQVEVMIKAEQQADAGVHRKLPTSFKISVACFEGESPTAYEAHLRYRQENGRVSFSYAVPEFLTAEREAFDVICERVRSYCKQNDIPAFGAIR